VRDLHPQSSEEGLEQEFNSLHAQREACEAYIKSQRHGLLARSRCGMTWIYRCRSEYLSHLP